MSDREQKAIVKLNATDLQIVTDRFNAFSATGVPYLENLLTIGRLVSEVPPAHYEDARVVGRGELSRHFTSNSRMHTGMVYLNPYQGEYQIGVHKYPERVAFDQNRIEVRYRPGEITIVAAGNHISEALSWDLPQGDDVGHYQHWDYASRKARVAAYWETREKNAYWSNNGEKIEVKSTLDQVGDRTVEFLNSYTSAALADFLDSDVRRVMRAPADELRGGILNQNTERLTPSEERMRQLKLLSSLFAGPLGYSVADYEARFPEAFPSSPVNQLAINTLLKSYLNAPELSLPLLVQPPEGRLTFQDIARIAGISMVADYDGSKVRDSGASPRSFATPQTPYATRVDEYDRYISLIPYIAAADISQNPSARLGTISEALAYAITYPELVIKEGLFAYASDVTKEKGGGSVKIPFIKGKVSGSIGDFKIDTPQLGLKSDSVSDHGDYYFSKPTGTRILVSSRQILVK